MAAKPCPICKTRRIGPDPDARAINLCNRCYTESGLENEHSDYGHDEPVKGCPTCALSSVGTDKPGHDKGKPKSHSSHAGHAHPSTKAARAACRKAAADKTASQARLERELRAEGVDEELIEVASELFAETENEAMGV